MGLEMARRQLPDLVVTDILMPHIDCLALAAVLEVESQATSHHLYCQKPPTCCGRSNWAWRINNALMLAAIKRTAQPILQQREP